MTAASMMGDRSTPDLAVKSYWAFREKADTLAKEAIDSAAAYFRQSEEIKKAYHSFFGGPALTDLKQESAAETFSREILEVEQQTPTRAVVLVRVRNTSPIPAGAVVDDYVSKAREEGDMYRYILDKDSTGWKISQLQSWLEYSKEWQDQFGRPPRVPTWTSAY